MFSRIKREIATESTICVVTPQAYFHFKHFAVIIKSNYDIAKKLFGSRVKGPYFYI
jgi:hypothetical protein